jgi:hypothetical protein
MYSFDCLFWRISRWFWKLHRKATRRYWETPLSSPEALRNLAMIGACRVPTKPPFEFSLTLENACDCIRAVTSGTERKLGLLANPQAVWRRILWTLPSIGQPGEAQVLIDGVGRCTVSFTRVGDSLICGSVELAHATPQAQV